MKFEDQKIKKKIKNGELRLNSWEAFIGFINRYKLSLTGCIYRGQSNYQWQLTPSFFRTASTKDNWENRQKAADDHLDNFKKFSRGRHRISYTDPNDEEINWWALGQHYGLATPLLDWVRSPYVAAFFA